MKHLIRKTIALAAVATLLTASVRAENAPPGYVDFGKLSPSSSGGEFVEVHIKSNLIEMVARLAEKAEPKAAEILRGLQVVRVNVIGLKDDNREEVMAKIKTVREELTGKGWERIVTAQEPGQDVTIFVKTRGSEAIEGVVVTVLDGKRQAVLVNVVGNIKPEKLAEIGERLNIDPLKKLGPAFEKRDNSKKES
jgi:hypothetical protein